MAERDPEPWQPPETFDGYKLLRPLGHGGMGRVYLAEDTLLERPVAIKLIAADRPDTRQRGRFFTEARAIARLQHPNVVCVHRIGEVQGRPYLVEELVRGVSLKDSPKPLSPEQVLRIALGLARGLAAAHREHILHRDVKPSNVILLPDGEVKLIDFGLALLQGEPGAADERLTSTGVVVGSRGYLAPELLRGEPPNPRSDLYSLGVVLQELLQGRHPIEEPTASRTSGESAGSEALAGDAAVAPPAKGALAARLREVVRRCLEYDPALRFASSDELGGALQALVEGPRAGPAPTGNPYRGLQAFEAEHRALFFGRGAEIRTVLERLRVYPLVLVVGDSGVGKSSLCRAGVLPLVEGGELGDGRTYRTVPLVPGRRPFTALVAALAPLLGAAEGDLEALGRREPGALARALRAAGRHGGALLFIDQMEELFTQSEPDEAAAFVEALGWLALPVAGARTLMTARGDFFTRLAALPGLGDELARALFVLKPLGAEGTREAILGPAQASGVTFESEALVSALIESAARAPGGLPILQFALAELWEARDRERRCIRAAALDALGGVAGALGRHADGVLALLTPAARQAARGLLLRLITGEGTRVRRTAADLAADEPAKRAALESLVRARLVVARQEGGDNAYELAHEALLQGWATLRGWLESDRTTREVLHRIEAATNGWEQQGRPYSALWNDRQLSEVRAAGDLDLPPLGRDFLAASRRALRRARARRAILMLALPLTGLLTWSGAWLKGHLELGRAVRAHLSAAHTAASEGRAWKAEAEAARARSFHLLDALGASALSGEEPSGKGALADGEAQWDAALEDNRRAEDAYLRAAQSLDTALLLDSTDGAARQLLADVIADRIVLAEWFHRPEQRRELLRRLASLDEGGARRQRLTEPPLLTLATLPAGAEVMLQREADGQGARRFSPGIALGRSPLAARTLESGPGSYLLTFRAVGRAPVTLPLLLAPGEHFSTQLSLPELSTIPEGFVYVPPGRFLFGSNEDEALRREFLQASVLRPVTTAGYVISRHEVTFAQWLTFLASLPPGQRARHLPGVRSPVGALALEPLKGGWRLTLQPTHQPFTARSGEPIRYPGRTRRASQDWLKFPVSAISLEDARAYLAWLDRSGRLPGARLCTEYEWERAARGADDRKFPSGDELGPDDANFDETYGRHPLGYGPDEVGSHPASASPFGVQDLAGNVIEWVRSVRARDEAVVRGGSWYYDRISNRSNNRLVVEPMLRDVRIGLRVCASFPFERAPAPAP